MMFKQLLLAASPALAALHMVDVGEQGFTFSPETITAVEGDSIVFTLFPNHDVVQGDFDSPCTPSDDAFYSGPYSGSDGGKKKFVVNVTSSDPIYYYCSIQRHCQSGMVGGANLPTSGDTIDAYASAAANAGTSERPAQVQGGEFLEDDEIASLTASASPSTSPTESSVPSGSSTASGTTASESSTPTTTSPPSSSTASESAGAAASSTTGAANIIAAGELSGFAAMVIGVAAWFL